MFNYGSAWNVVLYIVSGVAIVDLIIGIYKDIKEIKEVMKSEEPNKGFIAGDEQYSAKD